jgi:integrase
MTKKIHRLSAKTVASIRKPGRHADGGNLYLRVNGAEGRAWVFLFVWQGRTVELGLGSAHPGQVSLAEARERAADAHKLIRQGINPKTARRAPVDIPTFGEFADELVETLAAGFTNPKHIDQWRMTIRRHAAPLRDKPVNTISTPDVLEVLRPLWISRPETASRLRGRIERVLSAAKAQGLRTGDNPAQWRGHLDQTLSKRRMLTRGHHAALPYAKVPEFMRQLRARSGTLSRALEFLVLSAARSGEVRGACWREMNLDQRVWAVPAKRMKARREHRVPLTERMIELLGEVPIDPDVLIFPASSGAKPLSETAFTDLLDRMGYADITAHGFRSSFRDWTAEETTTSYEVAEMALAHVIANKAEAAYRRGDLFEKRRSLMNLWEAYCAGSAPTSASTRGEEESFDSISE